MALVTSVRPPKKTTKNDWCTSLTLVDPSILQEDGICGSVEGQGSRINCFTRKYEQWLPSPQVGDVIILRGVKLGGPTLVGYHDQLKWVIFNPEKSKLHHGEKGDAPESEGLADGFGHEFSPFWDAQGPELTACLRYADWWRAVSKIVEKYAARVHQLGPEDAPSYAARGSYGRVHRLITDASPDQQPRGFFDCTVEIMKGFLNDNGVYSLYVTDYTPNSQMTPVQAEWCPPELGDRILKVEMWDSASALGQTMETGEYWFLRNCKMKVSRGGYLEGTMQEARGVVKLEESESDHHPHLAALLQRKSDCEQHNSERDLKFEHKLIGDVQVNGVQYFTCTVEMLHVDHNPNGVPCCYITDYTRHPDLPLISETNDWARRLERRIVKVVLWDGQVDMAKNIETGSFYTIRNLRLLPSTTGDYIQGRLGGAERLINKLRSGDSTNERLATLLQNKQRWEEGHPKIDHRQADSPGTTSTKDHPRNGFSTIREILSSQICPNKYRTTARIRDFFPFNLNNFVMRRCKYCDKRIDDQYKECRACLDVDSTVKHLFCFFFLMEDDDGRELLVSVSDECSLLGGLTPTDLDEDSEALQDLTNRLKPFIGNLVEAHEGISNGEEVDKEVPMLNISIDAWQNGGNAAVSYGLMNVQIA
ncbi:hypothetical protein FIBSPDRAFT_519794 [Athelia psychrophila]|uniref:Protection of telomeres protein 1 n=1 Tax=Athelia psychrophila TaxID=1759441 RepID=A0A166JSA7_9AGAM|nr:hypothetical protein FIBSPDRAFT_519794 [Fibularhizoctonia sp. CBS 109695]